MCFDTAILLLPFIDFIDFINFYSQYFVCRLALPLCATSALKSKTAKETTALSNLPSRSLKANTLSKTARLSFTIHLRSHVFSVFSNYLFVKPGINLPEK